MTKIYQRIAAKAVIIDKQNRVLIVRRNINYTDGPNAGRWDFPGGRVEAGESFIDGLKREIQEEIKLDVEMVRPLHVGEWMPVVLGKQLHIYGVFTLCKVKNYDVKLDDENDMFEWLPIDKSPKLDLIEPAREFFELMAKGRFDLS